MTKSSLSRLCSYFLYRKRTKDEKIGLDAYFDDSWFHTYGSIWFFGKPNNPNVLIVFNSTAEAAHFRFSFARKADAINDFLYANYNDWDMLRVNLYQRVIITGGLITYNRQRSGL